MRKTLIIVLGSFLPFLLFSQKDFEGIITYKGFENNPENTFEAKFFLSNGKIKIKTVYTNPEEGNGRELVIYDFIAGLEYYIYEKNKQFLADPMEEASFDQVGLTFKDTSLAQKILGYPCRGYTITPEEKFNSELQAIFWYSDSIKFTIPAKYRGTISFTCLPDGNMLCLKMVLYDTRDSDDDKIETDSSIVNAVKIERMSLNESEFLPPAGYSKMRIESATPADSLKVPTPGTNELTAKETKKEQPKSPPAKPSGGSQPPAKKEKESKPVKG